MVIKKVLSLNFSKPNISLGVWHVLASLLCSFHKKHTQHSQLVTFQLKNVLPIKNWSPQYHFHTLYATKTFFNFGKIIP